VPAAAAPGGIFQASFSFRLFMLKVEIKNVYDKLDEYN
jgi:hypothetical protein